MKSGRSGIFLLASIFCCAAGAQAAGHVFALLADVGVAGESIYLSDLLPEQVPADVRASMQKIRVGNSPAVGDTFTVSGDRIASLLPKGERDEMLVPPQVMVHRSSRSLTRAEVVAAMQSALQSNKLPGASFMAPEDIQFSAPVRVTARDARLEVRRIDYDAALNKARFLMASAADHRSLPFLVTADLRSKNSEDGTGAGSSGSLSVLAGKLDHAHGETSLVSPDQIPMVQPRKLARLQILSGSMEMTLDVLPLEPGRLHETVRVRVPVSGKVLRGEVTGIGRLEAKF